MKLDLRQLRHILALDRYRSFARAAEAIGLTQPALSRSLQTVEESLGARLFDRDRSRVEPTPVGLRLIEHGLVLLKQAQEMERDLQLTIDAEIGLLRIGAGPYPAEISVGTAVGRVVRQHPGLLVDLIVGDPATLYPRVLSGDLDLIVADMGMSSDDDRLAMEPMPQHQGCLFCRAGHPLAGRGEITLDDVRVYPFVFTTLPARVLALAGKTESELRTDLPVGTSAPEIRVDTISLARQIVQESDAVSGALPSQIRHEVASGSLVQLTLDLPWLKTGYGIIRLANRTPSPAALAFMDALRTVEAEIAAAK